MRSLSAAGAWSIFPVRSAGSLLFRRLPREYQRFLFWSACGDYASADRALEGSNECVGLDHLLLVAYHNSVLPAVAATIGNRYDGLISAAAQASAERLALRQSYVRDVEDRIVGALDADDVQYRIVKGGRLARYYPDSALRSYRDIDIHIQRADDLRAAVAALGNLKASIYRAPCSLDEPNMKGFVFKCAVPVSANESVIVELHIASVHLGYAGGCSAKLDESVEPGSPAYDLLLQSCEWRSRYGWYQLRDYADFHFLTGGTGELQSSVLSQARSSELIMSLLAVAAGHSSMVDVAMDLHLLGRREALVGLLPELYRRSRRALLPIHGLQSVFGIGLSAKAGVTTWLEGELDADAVSDAVEWVRRSNGDIGLTSPMGTIFPPQQSVSEFLGG
ncbi:nucleotidyltransferase family protein [Nocardia sp. CA-129566]|uniref:nucleotidyltransferase family protein n=1 Tax=Nocardia sp. CA-129566 TaxID=3239976 RepID=UPI003D96A665